MWLDPATGIALGHRRLSVIDRTAAGHQPMASASGRYILTYNGEIYNHVELRIELERLNAAPAWIGRSDTEVLLASIDAYGISATLNRCNGMFACALWDAKHRTLTLARDRMGEKPLYFGWIAGRFAFASELKAFMPVPGWEPMIDRRAVTSLLRFGFVRGPQSAIHGIFRLPPATFLQLTTDQLGIPHDWPWLSARLNTYWSLSAAAVTGMRNPITVPNDSAKALEELLMKSVGQRMVADVPLGAFLSGGIDSSLITALMQAQSHSAVHTFSIGFHDDLRDEAPAARAISKHLGTSHTELYVDDAAAISLVPRISDTYGEPLGDLSQLPTLLLSELTRRYVTVALTGDGADELFAGYGQYFAADRFLRNLHYVPRPLLAALSQLCDSAGSLTRRSLSPKRNRMTALSYRFARLSERLSTLGPDAARLTFSGSVGYQNVTHQAKHWSNPDIHHSVGLDRMREFMYADQTGYLSDDVLAKVDRAAMAFGLETRLPMLDHRIVEFSWHLQTPMLINKRTGKLPLRRILHNYLPQELFDRPKKGFTPPMDAWLRGPLREWAETLLSMSELRELPMINATELRSIWNAHCRGSVNAARVLWAALVVIDWRKRYNVHSA